MVGIDKDEIHSPVIGRKVKLRGIPEQLMNFLFGLVLMKPALGFHIDVLDIVMGVHEVMFEMNVLSVGRQIQCVYLGLRRRIFRQMHGGKSVVRSDLEDFIGPEMFDEGSQELTFHGPDIAETDIGAVALGKKESGAYGLVVGGRFEIFEPSQTALVEFRDLGHQTEGKIEENVRMEDPIPDDAKKDREENEDPVQVEPNFKEDGIGRLAQRAMATGYAPCVTLVNILLPINRNRVLS